MYPASDVRIPERRLFAIFYYGISSAAKLVVIFPKFYSHKLNEINQIN